MTETKETRDVSAAGYDDRLPVSARALLPAIAMAVGTGLVVFYIAKIMAERGKIVLEPIGEPAPPARIRG